MKLNKTVKLWDAWLCLLRRLHRELRYGAMPFDQLLRTLPDEDLRPLAWFSCWGRTADLSKMPAVSQEEKPFAEAFFAGLGVTDLEGQLTHLEQCAERAEEYRQTAVETYRRCGKAYAMTGICAGLCIGITLL